MIPAAPTVESFAESPEPSAPRVDTPWRVLACALAAACLALAVASSWVCDDAYITFRSVDNLVAGYGPVWNTDERVQAFTNPLWLLLVALSYAFTGEAYLTSIVTSWLVTAAALLLVLSRARVEARGTALALLVLLASKSFCEFSTSGLENPLAHLLVGLTVLVGLRGPATERRVLWLALLTSLAALTRLDLVILCGPILVARALELRARASWRRIAGRLAAGFAPLLVWELFALLYYGRPFPNTAYAKLNTGIPLAESAWQGVRYLGSFLKAEPGSALAMSVIAFRGLRWNAGGTRPLGVALVLWALYQLKVGGDFMVGRYLSAAVFATCVALCGVPVRGRALTLGALFLALIGAFWFAAPPRRYLLPSVTERGVFPRGVSDEWYAYRDWTGLFAEREAGAPLHPFATAGIEHRERVEAGSTQPEIQIAIGFHGYFAGPRAVVIDAMALADPLLASLPKASRTPSRPGHFLRVVPAGYVASRAAGENRLADPDLARFYDELRLVVTGELLSAKRLAAIWRLNAGHWSETLRAAHRRLLEAGPSAEDPESPHRRLLEKAERIQEVPRPFAPDPGSGE